MQEYGMILRRVSVWFCEWLFLCTMTCCTTHENDARQSLHIDNQKILRISITDRARRTVDLVDSGDIGFFLAQLTSLTPRVEENVRNEYDLTLYKEYDDARHMWHMTTLRMGLECIGPLTPASEGVTRWYFRNDSLYNFIRNKFSGGR